MAIQIQDKDKKEQLTTYWDKDNPCQIYVMVVK